MTTKHQNEDRALTDNELEAVTGGGYVQFVSSGFLWGTRTDANIAFQNAHHLSLLQVPTLP